MPLEAEVAGAMLGFTEPNDFSSVLAERLHIAEEDAHAIAHDIDTELFQKIRESMKKMSALNDGGEVESVPPATFTQPTGSPEKEPVQEAPVEKTQETALETAPDLLPEVRPNVEPIRDPLSSHTINLPHKTQMGKLPETSVPQKNNAAHPRDEKYSVDPYREPVK